MDTEMIDTHQKALHINMDASKYGTFAEIGAGQEVARWFFRVGGAAGTIAKTISAYDMTISDAIYGPADRYVSRQRLVTMLDYEFELMRERLNDQRGSDSRFFVFADTVTARSYKQFNECHGWMGVRFQTHPQGDASEIIIHVRMRDKENFQQQEALGVMGVNLIHGALYLHQDPLKLLQSLSDSLGVGRVQVDMIKFSGPAFQQVDNRVMSLELVRRGLANATMFTADGEVVQAAEVLYKKPILVERGSFRPPTHVTLDMLACAQAQFIQEPVVEGKEPVVLMEMTLKNLTDDGVIEHKDFLDRVDLLGAMGKTVLISNYAEFHRLAAYLFRYTKEMVGIAMGVPTLKEIFEEKYYTDLDGGILESFGRLFKNALKLYVYPFLDDRTGSLITAENLRVAPNLRQLYAFMMENMHIQALRGFRQDHLHILSRDVLSKLRAGDSSWEEMVPAGVAERIKERRLFGYGQQVDATEDVEPVDAGA